MSSESHRPYTGLPLMNERTPQRFAGPLEGITVVSADNHLVLGGGDIFYDHAPEHLKQRVPRVWFDEENQYWEIGADKSSVTPATSRPIKRSVESVAGAWQIAARMNDLDGEGIRKEIVFPQNIQMYFLHPDEEAREWIFRRYNEYISELQKQRPDRFYGVGIGNYWNPATARNWLENMADLGFKTFMLPNSLGKKNERGKPLRYADPSMDPLWSAIEEIGLPVCFHIAERTELDGPGALAAYVFRNFGSQSFREVLADLIFGGVFDRHPTLRVVFAEAGLHWVPGALQDAEMIYDSFYSLLDVKPKKRPTEYWNEHCYATFQYDPAGLSCLDTIGFDHAMWAQDYPHNEGTFGYSGQAIGQVVETMNREHARLVLGGNAVKVFGLQ